MNFGEKEIERTWADSWPKSYFNIKDKWRHICIRLKKDFFFSVQFESENSYLRVLFLLSQIK